MIKKYLINSNFTNCRLDRWFKNNICQVPQSLFEKNLRKGKIKVNNKKKKSSYKLQINDEITLVNFNPREKNLRRKLEIYQASNTDIYLYQDLVISNNNNFIVLNKPAGIAVQSGTKSKKNIIDIIKKTNYFLSSSPYTVHRIDKETTGILLIAKNRKYAQILTSLFRLRKIQKTYIALAIGKFEKKKGDFNDMLTYYENKKKTTLNAITNYKVLDSNENYSLIKLQPKTGRKHQLRKQLLLHNHPILGDQKYSLIDNKKNKKNILMLHAYKIKFFINSEKFEFTAKPNINFTKIIKEKNLKNF